MADHKWTNDQWPDNICSGLITYDPSSVYEGGFVLRDDSHGIPVFGSVHAEGAQPLMRAETFNYPGQTEAITRRLVACWNAMVGTPIDEIERRAATLADQNAVTEP